MHLLSNTSASKQIERVKGSKGQRVKGSKGQRVKGKASFLKLSKTLYEVINEKDDKTVYISLNRSFRTPFESKNTTKAVNSLILIYLQKYHYFHSI